MALQGYEYDDSRLQPYYDKRSHNGSRRRTAIADDGQCGCGIAYADIHQDMPNSMGAVKKYHQNNAEQDQSHLYRIRP